MALAERDETMQWYIDMLEETLADPKDEVFLKACRTNPGDTNEDGVIAGFCGWEVIDRAHHRAKNPEPAESIAKQTALESHAGHQTKRQQKGLPEILVVDAWMRLSDNLRRERQRVLGNLDNVCRLTCMSVHPDLQRLGIGSIMMQRICNETDACQGRYAYVLAAPEGVQLYLRFGFEAIGKVETIHGNIIIRGLRDEYLIERQGVSAYLRCTAWTVNKDI
ncbi:hypothetical protein N0V82_004894 [Gnomoniopsis sp. IMI 355080]|nr:hypothetical protein N0V82_004894 [Gnomoniopsis sp. IMI 355080]